jgi:hypothetical protein
MNDSTNGVLGPNFGFVTVTGQERGAMWSRARRSRYVGLDVAAAALREPGFSGENCGLAGIYGG